MIGHTLSHYEILEEIGRGGMGIVYRARDTKLHRQVAIKVLPDTFYQGEERLARFKREARLLATLNHPNIAAIYELEESDGVHFLVLEYVPGETLRERIKQGIPMHEALPLFRQIAEALEAAHEKGIVHRDLKPANLKVTPEGKAKVLDFGLAKALAGEAPTQDLSQSPTLTREATETGVLLGTAPYMSPEQARGKAVDRRTDIWAFGCCLYETLTGKVTFLGETVSDTIATILKQEPEWQALPPGTPAIIRSLLRRCLTKDPTHRLQHIGDARVEIEEALGEPPTVEPQAVSRSIVRRWITPAVLTVVVAGIVAWALLPRTPLPPPSATVSRLAISLPLGHSFERSTGGSALALSPDGSRLAYVAGGVEIRQLYMRELDEFEARPVPGTEGAESPFFSPDGRWVGFITAGELKKVMMGGAAPIKLCDIERGPTAWRRGAGWGPDGMIYFSAALGNLWRVPENGGEPETVTELNPDKGEWLHDLPDVLPNGEGILFEIADEDIFETGSFGSGKIAVLSLETGVHQVLVENAFMPRYAGGHLVYLSGGVLVAAPFDLERLEVTGHPVTLVENVMWSPGTGWAHFALSRRGALAYVAGGAIGEEPRALVWADRSGETVPVTDERHGFYRYVRVSPDGRRLALVIRREGNQDLWVYDIAQDTFIRLTSTSVDEGSPTWHPDSSRVSYAKWEPPQHNIFWIPADGSGESEMLFEREVQQAPRSWSPDGNLLVFGVRDADTGLHEIWVLPFDEEREPWPLLNTSFDETDAQISPDGKRLAYVSNDTGRQEVYVTTFPVVGAKRRVSTDGGHSPVWAPSGRELFYRSDNKLMAVSVDTAPDLSIGTPRILFEANFGSEVLGYDITPDGRRFVIIQGVEQTPPEIRVILNWPEELIPPELEN
jgi:serine/threonine protein kinase/Tol biopolymer transport system component